MRAQTIRTRRPGLIQNALSSWAAYVVSALVGFFLSPYIVHHLGNAAYGLWALLGSVVGYLGLLDFGVRGAVARFVAAHQAKGDHESTSRTVGGALRLFAVTGLIAFVAACTLAVLVDRLFVLPADLIGQARTVIVLGGLSIWLAFVGGVFGGVIAGLQRFDLDSRVEIAVTLLRVVCVIAALESGLGLVALAVIQLTVSLLQSVASFTIVRRLYPELSLRVTGPFGPAMTAMLSFGLLSSVLHASTAIIFYTDAVIIAAFLPVGWVTFYAIATSLAEYARQLVLSVSRIVSPRASASHAVNGPAEAGSVTLLLARWTSFVTIPIAMTFVFRGEAFINLWMGPEYGAISGPILTLLAITVALAGGNAVAIAALQGIYQHGGIALASAAQAVANLIISVALIRRYGLIGVAVGTVIPALILNFWFLPWYLKRKMGISPLAFANNAWVLPILAALPFAIATIAVERRWPADSLVVFFGQVALLLPLVVVTAMVVACTPEERARVWELANGAVAALRRP